MALGDFLIKIAEDAAESAKHLVEHLPAPMSPTPNLTSGTRPQIQVSTIVDRLEGISKVLKSRDIIRELAAIDILLNELGMASLFPELTDSQSKLIESFGYASNKIESAVAKLRGSGVSRPAPASSAKPVQKQQMDTTSLQTKPVGTVKKTSPAG